MSSTRRILPWLLGIGLALGSPDTKVWAQSSKKGADQQAERLDVAELRKDLQSRQEERVVAALNRVKDSPAQAKDLAADVETLLARGTTLKISLNALRTLAALGEERSSKIVAPYVRHRVGSVRHAAANALLKTRGPDAIEALRAALRAPDTEVRNIAARGLGGLGAKQAVGDLFQALDHRVFAAAVSIGKLCEPGECLKFMERVGRLQLEVVTSGADEILFRAETEIDEKTKLEVIRQLAKLRTLPATEYLADVYRRWPKQGNKALKKALADAVEDNGGELGDDE